MDTTKPTPGEWFIRELFPGTETMFYIAAPTYEGHPYHGAASSMEIMSDEDYPTKRADAEFIVEAVREYRKILAIRAARDEKRSRARTIGVLTKVEDITYTILRKQEATNADNLDTSDGSDDGRSDDKPLHPRG